MTYMKYDMEYWTFPNIFDHSLSSETNMYVLYVSVFMTIEFQSRVSSGLIWGGFFLIRRDPSLKSSFMIQLYIGVKPIIHQSELVVPFKENSSFRFVVL